MKKLKIKQKPNHSGFTLVELVIVIAIVIILSVVSIPIYQGYTRKAKMSEAYALLGTISSAQKAYYSEYGNFLGCRESSAGSYGWFTNNETVLGVDARGNKYFTWFHVGDSGGDMKAHFWASVMIPEELRQYTNKNRIGLLYNITTGATYLEDLY